MRGPRPATARLRAVVEGTAVGGDVRARRLGRIERAEPDYDIDYTLPALALVEEHDAGFGTEDVARRTAARLASRPAAEF